MNISEILLVSLAEECAEVQYRVSKALRFGMTEVQPGLGALDNNKKRLEEEIVDLVSLLQIMAEKNLIDFPVEIPYDLTTKKRIKVESYLNYSEDLGVLHR